MTDYEAKRLKNLSDSDSIGRKKRFGLFSQPITTAVSDNGQYKTKLHPKENGKPILELPNIQAGSSKLKKGCFGELNSLAVSKYHDEFIEPLKRSIKEDHLKFNTPARKEINFFPSAGYKSVINSSYKYIQQNNPELDPKRHRDTSGRVKEQPKNFYTNVGSKITDYIYKHPQHYIPPYSRELKLELQKEKKLRHQDSFKPNSFCPKTFNNDKDIYQNQVTATKKIPSQSMFNIYTHETVWKRPSPAKEGLKGFINPFPQYISSPQNKTQKKKLSDKESFKLMDSTKSVPCPSISLNRINISRNLNINK